MGRYDEDFAMPNSGMSRQRDLVLSINEFCFLQSKTDGSIKAYVGPLTMTISQQESLVTFNSSTKKFEDTSDFEKAKQLFCSAPEGWYVILKNPAEGNQHPEATKANITPSTIRIGKKVNIPGPTSFGLYPGQMAKVVQGHKLRSNQYLIARVYDADAANADSTSATVIDTEGKEVDGKNDKYFVGQLLVIKGTEVSFYIPPTGVEVIPFTKRNDYVRDAVTLERLEYAILKDEDGEKRYIHGPAVVFPEPTESFVETPKGGTIFRALELSPISGIYVKVIAAYEENGIKHPIGEELFITGNDQMIYYPRPEHAMIQYDGRYMHHAIAIPAGEGRYIMNRITGEISTVVGPKMYLPDPRTEVVVKRKLTRNQCELWYPGNAEVLRYNDAISEKAIQKMASRGIESSLDSLYCSSNQEATLAIFEANANISRGTSYTKPRTITLDTKYDGVVSIDLWTGYAVNVVSRTGKRETIVGPVTRLLDYDESLEVLELSTGKPKSTDNLLKTVYLRVENNKISDVINVQTKDFVDVQIRVSYCVDFLEEYKNKWFSVENYIKYLTDRMRSLMKREAKLHTIEDFYANSTDIVRKIVLNAKDGEETKGRLFKENGMLVHDVEVLSIAVERSVAAILEQHQESMIRKTLELSDAEARFDVVSKLAKIEKEEEELKQANRLNTIKLNEEYEKARLDKQKAIDFEEESIRKAKRQAEVDMQVLVDAIHKAEDERQKRQTATEVERRKALAEIKKAEQDAYAETVKTIIGAISPDLAAALTSTANASTLAAVSEAMSPYAIAQGESIANVTDRLLRGTSLEKVLENLSK